MFQSTLPRGERRLCRWLSIARYQFQSTLPRGERLPHKAAEPIRRVSIHAPTWGATNAALRKYHNWHVSIHAPTWGATYRETYFETHKWFQSTLPRGERLHKFVGNTKMISFNPRSHVGSDHAHEFTATVLPSFNPRSHVGSDIYRLANNCSFEVFQSTLPRGERLYIFIYYFRNKTVSIHAPTWGATLSSYFPRLNNRPFQSTLPRGERPSRARTYTRTQTFQSTLPRGERHSLNIDTIRAAVFQSTLPRGERRKIFCGL